jgi:hypothetical protein
MAQSECGPGTKVLRKACWRPQKRTPGSPRSRGSLQVVTLVGSCDPGGFGVSGDGGAAGIGPTAIPLIGNFTLRK